MKNSERIVYGIAITVAIYLSTIFIGRLIHFNNAFIASSFATHTIMLLLSIFGIIAMRRNFTYHLSLPKFKFIFKPIIYAIITTIVVNILMTIITKAAGGKIESHPLLVQLTPLQVFIFVFIYASIAEELLFRGFLLNLLEPLRETGITILKIRLSLPIIISALMFGLAHLCLIMTGVQFFFLLRIVIFTMSLGLIAGYYQEKYNNNAYAIIVHMSGNLLALLGAIISQSV